jgi:hypothetical protein
MARTAWQVATEMSRDLQLELSNGEWGRLVRTLEPDPAEVGRELYAQGREAVRAQFGGTERPR